MVKLDSERDIGEEDSVAVFMIQDLSLIVEEYDNLPLFPLSSIFQLSQNGARAPSRSIGWKRLQAGNGYFLLSLAFSLPSRNIDAYSEDTRRVSTTLKLSC